MIAAPIPQDDAERLEALRGLGLLDTPAEERFDRLTRLLTVVLHVPMAYISLVDAERQWFKSSCGLNASETPRAISFCGHAILADDPLIVADAANDVRFRDNPLVTGEPFIRFYAGHPLSAPNGHKVGTLCVADRQARSLHEGEIDTLREMAKIVERELSLVEVAHLQRNLLTSQRRLAEELSEAARYVRSLLPQPLEGPVRTRSRFEPSSQLGGDFFGCDWIDQDHLMVYLLDVSGHGVGAALLSISVANALRARSLPDTDFRDPGQVLERLNGAFPMERQDEKYFTAWYGVFDRRTRRLRYASAGHPPAVLVSGPTPEQAAPVELGMNSLAIGMMPDVTFASAVAEMGAFGKLFVFSDGVYEIPKPDGSIMRRAELVAYLSSLPINSGPDDIWQFIQAVAGGDTLPDDFSVFELTFA
jgi:sigma-B regulation protein RsbU (phosphoserine phosphatase)